MVERQNRKWLSGGWHAELYCWYAPKSAYAVTLRYAPRQARDAAELSVSKTNYWCEVNSNIGVVLKVAEAS